MVYNIYSIKDEVVSFGVPFICDNDAAATRMLQNAFNIDNSIYQTAPADYTLYRIGTFDNESACITSITPTRVVSCSDFRKDI